MLGFHRSWPRAGCLSIIQICDPVALVTRLVMNRPAPPDTVCNAHFTISVAGPASDSALAKVALRFDVAGCRQSVGRVTG
jgi:hypothetical protein